MADILHHERLYRGRTGIERLGQVRVAICGAGALGSNLADTLTRQGVRQLRVIDRDRVEQHNVNTQIYGEADVGAWKVDILRSHIFRTVGLEVEVLAKEFNDRTCRKFLQSADVVLDTFDNSASRAFVQNECRRRGLECLHIGLFADYGEVIWDAGYRVPQDGDDDVCDYPLARNLVTLTVAVAAETLLRYLIEGGREDWSVTLGDFAVRRLEQIREEGIPEKCAN